MFNSVLVRRMHERCAVEAFLALALLLQQVVAAGSFHSQFTGSGLPDSLLRAAVGLHLWHKKCATGREYKGSDNGCKGKFERTGGGCVGYVGFVECIGLNPTHPINPKHSRHPF